MASEGVILLAEDSEIDAFFTKRAFAKAGLLNAIHVVTDGEEVISYLSATGKYSNRAKHPVPALLLLDLKMPHKNGLEVLRWIGQQPALSSLCVVVLTGSAMRQDMEAAYALGATFFLTKPLRLDQLLKAGCTIEDHRLCVNKAAVCRSRPVSESAALFRPPGRT